MKTSRRFLLLVLPVVSLSLAACGGPPAGDVAVVKTDQGDLPITKAEFARWQGAAQVQTDQKPLAQLVKLQAPDFKACIADLRKAVPTDSQRKKTSDADLKKQCQTKYDTVRNQAMQQLVNLNFLKAESARRGITFRKAELKRTLDNLIQTNFQGQKGYQDFLKQEGLNQADVDLNVLGTVAQQKILEQLQAEDKTPTDAEVQRYFNQKKSTYVQPETRDLRLIKTATEANANAAKAAIAAGGSWTEIAKKYSTDAATKDQGGKVLATTADQQPPEFGATVFKGKKNELLGPIKTSLGWYVVKIQNITPEKQPVYSELKAQLSQALLQENQQNTINRFKTLFLARWSARTTCDSDFDELSACGGSVGASADDATTKAEAPPGAGVPRYAPKDPTATTPTQDQLQQQAAQTAAG